MTRIDHNRYKRFSAKLNAWLGRELATHAGHVVRYNALKKGNPSPQCVSFDAVWCGVGEVMVDGVCCR